MKKKKKGFTMVELLAVIVILGILVTVGIATTMNVINKAHKEYYRKQENMLLLAGKEYYSDYRSKLPKQIGGVAQVSLTTLIKEKYIKEIVDYRKTACKNSDSGVKVQKQGEGQYSYTTFLNCNSYNGETEGTSPVITFLPNSSQSNKTITVEMRVKDDQEVSYYSYQVYKLGSKEAQDGEVISSVSKTKYNKVIKIKIEEAGIYRIRGTAWDNNENVAIKDSGIYEIDNTPPDCKKLVINTDYEKNMTGETWTYKNVKLTLDFSQVGKIESWDWETNKDSRNCTWEFATKDEQLDQIVKGKNSSFYYQSNNKASTKTKTISEEGARQGRITLYDEFGNSCKVTTEKFLIDKTKITSLTLTGSTESGQVTNKAVKLTATPNPECVRSGYTYIFERKEDNNWIEVSRQESNEYTVDIEANQEINQKYRVRVITGSGYTKTSGQYQVHIDKIAPKCDNFTFNPNGTNNAWKTDKVLVTLNPNNTDIDNYLLSMRESQDVAFTRTDYTPRKRVTTYTIEKQGRTLQLEAEGYDKAGNSCKKESNLYLIDWEKPTIDGISATSTDTRFKSRNVTVTFSNAKDNLSGVSQMCIQEDSNVSRCSWKTYSASSAFTVSNDYTGGTVTIYGWVKDGAGNVSSSQSTTYTTYTRCSQTVNDGSSYNKGDWSACSASCGGGTQKATNVQPKKDAYLENTACAAVETANYHSQPCNTQDCCSSVTYTQTTSCSKACDGGTYKREAYSAYNGQRCSASDDWNGAACNTQGCCSSTTAGAWGACSASCGGGTQSRTLYSAYNGTACSTQSQSCNAQDCCSSVTYTQTATCSKACNSGTYYREAYSAYNSQRCPASDDWNGAACNTQKCCSSVRYEDGSKCSKSCGGGTKNRLAYSVYNNKRCTSKDKDSGGSACNTKACDTIPNGICNIRGSTIKTGGGSWTCTGGHTHSDGKYYQVYCKNNGVYTPATKSPTRVCPDSPFGPTTNPMYYIHDD